MLYISLLILFSQTPAQNAEEYYKSGEYAKALEEYNKYLDSGIRNAELYLNIGNCFYRMGDFGKSLLYYRRGWFLDPSNENILNNISLFKRDESNPNPFISFFSRIIDRISLRVFSYLLVLSFSFLVIVISIRLIQTVKLIAFPANPLLILAGSFFIFSLIGFSIWYGRIKSKWVVTTATTIAYSGPNEEFKELMRVDKAEEGSLVREDGGWWLVHFRSGEGGWIDSTTAELVIPSLK
jgi:tetratricopeptide (TPR) repeat protein